MRIQHYLLIAAASLLAYGCGKPPAGERQQGGGGTIAVVAEADVRAVNDSVRLVGTLTARNDIDVLSEISGTVVEILFAEGNEVAKDEDLVLLDDAKIKARTAEAKSRLDLAKANFKRAKDLLKSETISEQEYDTAKADFEAAEAAYDLLKEELDDTRVVAAFAGIVGDRMVSPGQFVAAGQPLTRLVQMHPLDVEFSVPEVQLANLKAGKEILFHTQAFPDRVISGTVFFIDPYVDPSTRTVLAKAEVDNTDGSLRPGLFGRVELILSVDESGVVIPEASVRFAGDQASVVVMNAEGVAEFRNVTLGARMSNMVQVLTGVAGGERVVVEGHQKIFAPGTPIIISPESARFGIEPEPMPTPIEDAPEAEAAE